MQYRGGIYIIKMLDSHKFDTTLQYAIFNQLQFQRVQNTAVRRKSAVSCTSELDMRQVHPQVGWIGGISVVCFLQK